ncbi:MAG TPA: DUF885 domain-containing protein [Burkholderiaceae bacterium]|jgi:uncharacterized protein (DUF885 family)
MQITRRTVLSSALASAFVPPAWGLTQDFDAWSEALARDIMRAEPSASTFSQYLPAEEQVRLDAQLTPNTPAYRAERLASTAKALAALKTFDRAKLNPQQRCSAALIEWTLQGQLDAAPFEDSQFVFNQFGGLHVRLVNFLSQAHPIRNAVDVGNYLSRLGQVAAQIDNGIARAQEAQKHGFLMPRFINTAVLGQFQRFLAGEPAQNVLVASLGERMKAAKLDDPKALAEAERIVHTAVIPAYRRAQAQVEAQLPLSNDDAGLWRLPNGTAAYANALRRFTTTDYSPAEVHEIGLKEVARIEAVMDGLLKGLGYKDGSVKQRYAQLNTDSQPKEDDPRPMLLARFESILRDAQERSKLVFASTPKAPVVVKREPPFTEKTAAAHYTSPARDGTRPGIFWAPLPGPTYNVNGMRTLVYHEAVPGHHFQIATQQETTSLPRYRQAGIFSGGSAFAEGWALYAEQLAVENGWYEGDPKGRLGQLDAELFRARRLVVDTGLHTMKWTRQQAIDYGTVSWLTVSVLGVISAAVLAWLVMV